MKVAQLCLTLCNPMDYTVHGILQARILERVAFPFSRGSSQPKDWTQVSRIAGRFFTNWVIRDAHKEGWVPKNGYFRIAVLEKTFESPLDSKEINQSILKKINPEYSLKGLVLKLKFQYFGHLMQRVNSLEKNPDPGKDWRPEEKRMTKDEMVGWHHWLNVQEFEQTPGDSKGQGSLTCCSLWGCRVGHDLVTEQEQHCGEGEKILCM